MALKSWPEDLFIWSVSSCEPLSVQLLGDPWNMLLFLKVLGVITPLTSSSAGEVEVLCVTAR